RYLRPKLGVVSTPKIPSSCLYSPPKFRVVAYIRPQNSEHYKQPPRACRAASAPLAGAALRPEPLGEQGLRQRRLLLGPGPAPVHQLADERLADAQVLRQLGLPDAGLAEAASQVQAGAVGVVLHGHLAAAAGDRVEAAPLGEELAPPG